MKTCKAILIVSLFFAPLVALAQESPNSGPPDSRPAPPDPLIAQQSQGETPSVPVRPMVRGQIRIDEPGAIMGYEPLGGVAFGGGLGAWWKNSEIASKLGLSDEQAKKISQTFLDHRLKLIDLRADVDKEELRLQPLLDLDQPDESKVGAQIDSITSARGKLERENAMMMLDIRRQLTVEQWKKLKSIQAVAEEREMKNVFFMRTKGPRGGQEFGIEGPPPPLQLPDDMPIIRQH